MTFWQYSLRHPKILRELTNFVCEGFKVLDFLQLRKSGRIAGDLCGVILEVLQLSRRVVGLEAFEKLFRFCQDGCVLLDLCFGVKRLPPKRDATKQVLAGKHELLNPLGDDFVELLDRNGDRLV